MSQPFHPNAILHNVQQATQPGNGRVSRIEVLAHLLSGLIAAPIVWFVIGPAWVTVINWLARIVQ